MAPSDAPKAKKTSAYFCFCTQHREQVKARLRDAGQSVSAPALSKALSELWRSLSDAEKQKYKDPSYLSADLSLNSLPSPSFEHDEVDRACKPSSPLQRTIGGNGAGRPEAECVSMDKDAADPEGACVQRKYTTAEVANLCQDESKALEEPARVEEDALQARDEGLTENAGSAFPLARVKRIIKLDKEIRVIAADASNLIALASQLFLEHLAMAAHDCALKKKHKTVRREDVKNAAKSEPRIEEFLAEALSDMLDQDKNDEAESTEDEADDGLEVVHEKVYGNKRSKSGKKALPDPPAGNRRIAEFFMNTNNVKVSNTQPA